MNANEIKLSGWDNDMCEGCEMETANAVESAKLAMRIERASVVGIVDEWISKVYGDSIAAFTVRGTANNLRKQILAGRERKETP